MKTYSEFNIDIATGKTTGNTKTFCPQCHNHRHNKRDKSLSVNLDKGIWKCHYCGWTGTLHVGERAQNFRQKEYRRPCPRPITNLSAKAIAWFKERGISESTLAKAKVSEGEHFMPQIGDKRNTVQFNFYLNGELINVKYRTGDKMFAMEAGAELIPYNLDGITGKSECIITEGEIDCLSFIEIGKTNCISVPNGASSNLSYLDDFIDGWFEDKQTIYIAVDTDQKGQVLRDELLRRFGNDRCKIVTFGDDCKDANEHLVKYGAASLKNCLAHAKEVKVEGIFTLSDFEESLDDLFCQGMPMGAVIGHANFDKLCSFETKRLAVITGIPGSGKSEFLDEIAERLNLRYGWKFAYFSPENSPLAYHAGKLISKITGKSFNPEDMSYEEYEAAKKHVEGNFFFINPKDNFSVENILDKAKYLVRRYGIKALVIDPYNRLDMASTVNRETDMVRDILRTLTNFAQQNDVLVFLMAHPTKLMKDKNGVVNAPSLYDISGSAHFFNMADYGLVVHRNRVKNVVEIHVKKIRFKHLGTVGTVEMLYNERNGRYIPVSSNQAAIYDDSNHLSQRMDEQHQYLTENSIENIDPLSQYMIEIKEDYDNKNIQTNASEMSINSGDNIEVEHDGEINESDITSFPTMLFDTSEVKPREIQHYEV